MDRGLSTLPPNRATAPIGVVIENPLMVEEGQRFLRQVLWPQTSLTILGGGEGMTPIPHHHRTNSLTLSSQ